MSAVYSNSRIEAFEKCPRKYKFRYVDGIRSDREGIEAFVGKRVHETLERLYRDVKLTKLNTLDELLHFYESAWEKNWHGKVTIVRDGVTPGHYYGLGRQCLIDYYNRYAPFDQGKTLGLEERIEMKLTDGDKTYSVQGFIDRLTWIPETETYEIHDYKTGATVPSQEDADQDRQLALYQLGLTQRWPDAKTIKLIWHYLPANKEIVSTRTTADLKTLEKEVIEMIRRIEQEAVTGQWEIRISRLCEWCEYKPMCPAWKHPLEMETLPPNEYLANTGVQLVQAYAELDERKSDLQAEIKAIETEQQKVEEAILAYGEKHGLAKLDGPSYQVVIKTEDDLKLPRKMEDPLSWELLRTTLKNAGKLEDVSTVNANMLKYAMKRNKWPEALVQSVLSFVTHGIRKTISLLKKS